MKKMMKNKKGFTLVELIVVIAILGVLAVIMVPAFTGYVAKAKVSKEVSSAKSWCTAYQAAYADVNAGTDTWVITTSTQNGIQTLPTIENTKSPKSTLAQGVTLTGSVSVDISGSKCTVNQ
ncbi:MAG: pilin [Erysipelotrichaceae bacterium]